MATPTPPRPTLAADERVPGNSYLHNVALVVTPVAIGAMFLPPRHLDIRMVVLGGCSLWGINQLRYDWTGKTFAQRMPSVGAMTGHDLPERAQVIQARLREEKLRRERDRAGLSAEDAHRLEEQRKKVGAKGRGPLEAIWMGDETEDWKAKRDRKEREAFKEGGGGVWGLITDQISEVWGGKKSEDGKEAAKPKGPGEEPKGKP